MRQIIDPRDTDKSRYFAMTEFNKFAFIRKSFPDSSGKRSAIFHKRAWLQITMSIIIIISRKTHLDVIGSHEAGSRAMEEKTMHRMM